MGELGVIAIGGALGALFRFWVSGGVHAWLGQDFPYGTLTVNVLGSFIIGIAFILLTEKLSVSSEIRAFIMIGFLGAFTTFSAFSLETLLILQQGLFIKAFSNMILSVFMCLLATWLGIVVAKSVYGLQ